MAKTKKAHHFVPELYLEGFGNPEHKNQVCVYTKGSEEIFWSQAGETGFINYYHAFQRADGTKDTNTIEDLLCDYWEGPAAKVIRSIREGTLPSGQDRALFAEFLGLSFTRTPNHRLNVDSFLAQDMKMVAQVVANDPARFKKSLENYEAHTGIKVTDDPESLRNSILEGEHEVKPNPELYLSMFIEHGILYGELINRMSWNFFRAPGSLKFVTSDNPFFFCDPTADSNSGVGLRHKNVEISFPVSQEIAMIAGWGTWIRNGLWMATEEQVCALNCRSVIGAQRWVYASEESDAIAQLVKLHAETRPRVMGSFV